MSRQSSDLTHSRHRSDASSSSSSSSYSSSKKQKQEKKRQQQQQQQKRKERRRLLREQRILPHVAEEMIPGYQQGRILGTGSFGSAWTLVPVAVPISANTTNTINTANTAITTTKKHDGTGFRPLMTTTSHTNVDTLSGTVRSTTTTTIVTVNHLEKEKEKDKEQQQPQLQPQPHPLTNKSNVTNHWILKVSTLQRDRDGRLKDTFDREVFYLKHLSRITPKMTPTLLHAKIIDKNGLQIMERFDDTVKMLGLQQAQALNISGRTSQAFTWKQLTRIIDLAKQLDFMGIVHGDLKHSNMLFRWSDAAKNPNNVEICVCDFGFSGTVSGEHYYPLIGFMRHYGCNPKRTIHYGSATKSRKNVYAGGILQPRFKLQSPIPSVLLPAMNRCQLYIALAEQTRLYLWNDKQYSRVRPGELLAMMNLDSPEIVESFKQYCPRVRTLPRPTFLTKLFFPLEKTRYEFNSRTNVNGGKFYESYGGDGKRNPRIGMLTTTTTTLKEKPQTGAHHHHHHTPHPHTREHKEQKDAKKQKAVLKPRQKSQQLQQPPAQQC